MEISFESLLKLTIASTIIITALVMLAQIYPPSGPSDD